MRVSKSTANIVQAAVPCLSLACKLCVAATQLEINIANIGLRMDPGSQRISNTRESPHYSHAAARQLHHSLTAATQLYRYTCGDSISGILSKQGISSKT